MSWQPLEKHSKGPSHVTDALNELMQKLSGTSLSTFETVIDSWSEIVGEAIAAESSPVKIDSGCLTVSAKDAIWASELRWLEPKIIEKIMLLSNVTNGEKIRKVRVVIRA